MIVPPQANLTDSVMSGLTVTGRMIFRSREYEACGWARESDRLQGIDWARC